MNRLDETMKEYVNLFQKHVGQGFWRLDNSIEAAGVEVQGEEQGSVYNYYKLGKTSERVCT